MRRGRRRIRPDVPGKRLEPVSVWTADFWLRTGFEALVLAGRGIAFVVSGLLNPSR